MEKNKKTKENRCKYVEKRVQYKVIIVNEKKKWQERNTENIKRLVDKKDNTQLWRGIRNLTHTKGRGYEIDPVRGRQYFWRLSHSMSNQHRSQPNPFRIDSLF
jgi:hypothetical protein